MKEIAITIKPTLACNMHCKHCFNGANMNNEQCLDIETALKLVDIASAEYETVKVTFHGGELSMMGYDFYSEFYASQQEIRKERGTIFSNYFTTNGLLLNKSFVQLLKANNVMINISFDGPFNDVLRYNTDEVYQNILLVKSLGARMRVFCTLTSESIRHLIDIYEWFNSRLIDFKIAPLEPWGYATEHLELLIRPDEYISKIMDAYKYWAQDKKCKIRFNTFEEFINLKRTQQFKPFWFNREIALNPDGCLYPFGRPNDANYCLGTPYSIRCLSSAFASAQYNTLLENLSKSRQKRCVHCPSVNVCNGVIENMTYMYVSDENLVDERCKIANELFQNAIAINESIRTDLERGAGEQYNPIVRKYLDAEKDVGREKQI